MTSSLFSPSGQDLTTRLRVLINEGRYEELVALLQDLENGENAEEAARNGQNGFPLIQSPSFAEAHNLDLQLQQDEALEQTLTHKCHDCNNLDARGHPMGQIQQHNGRFVSSVQLMATGRGLCRTFWQTIECGYCEIIYRAGNLIIDRDPEIQWHIFQKLNHITLVEDQPILLTVRCLTKAGKWTNVGIELFKLPDTEVLGLPTIGSAVPISRNTGSEQCFDFIRSSLDVCKESHQTCRQKPVALPKRVLNLRSSASWSPEAIPSVNLHTSRPMEEYPYIAMSHCWGRDAKKELRLTRGNGEKLEKNVPWDDLPNTFQDGILVAWRLGIHYIWIDSLCIVQDDKEDWETEAAKMGDIYHHAYLTVAASSSPSGDFSFLRERPDLHAVHEIKSYKPGKVSLLTWLGRKLVKRKGTILARRTSNVAHFEGAIAGWSRTGSTSELIPGPLSTRAWCLQERILSTRIVHFTDEGIRWECKEVTESEDRRSWMPGPLSKWEHLRAMSSFCDPIEANLMRNNLQNLWRQIVREYTRRNMTFRRDVFNAISSIAARMHSYIESPYLAGLWQDRFIEDLCWRPVITNRAKAPLLKPDEVIDGVSIWSKLPSWSWMSVDRAIDYAVIDVAGVFEPHCKLIGGQCLEQINGLPSFNKLPAPTVILEGRMVELQLSFYGHSDGADSQRAFVGSKAPTADFNMRRSFSSQNVVYDAPLVEDKAFDVYGKSINTVRRARGGETLEYFLSNVFCFDVGQWIPNPIPYALEGVDHNFVLVLAPSVTVPGAF